jgi:hypothetical protein
VDLGALSALEERVSRLQADLKRQVAFVRHSAADVFFSGIVLFSPFARKDEELVSVHGNVAALETQLKQVRAVVSYLSSS